MHAKKCDNQKKKNNGCKGCRYRLGCSKVAALIFLGIKTDKIPQDDCNRYVQMILAATSEYTVKRLKEEIRNIAR